MKQRKGRSMLIKINRVMRKILLITGAVLLVFKVTEKKKTDRKSEEEGFPTEEFDDIW